MIRFLDIQRQTTWQKKIQILVLDVGRAHPIERSADGWCQCIQARDGVGREEPMNYFWNEDKDEKYLMGEIPHTMIGDHWYDIIWRKDKEYFQCRLAEAPPAEEQFEKNVWEEKDERITRMSCVKSAIAFCDIICRGGQPPSPEDIIEIAKDFRDYIYGVDKL